MAEAAPGGLRYKAFLSYSHKDSAAAARLHRRLESYRLPKRLVGRDTERGPVPARLAPIFRDRDELPAVADLSETVRSALAQSGALIVICSPAGAASLWVAEEIRVFRALHPERPVLAAVIAGEPGDCFPESLRAVGSHGSGHEPLAADFRPEADGERLGLLKLVAGLTGVGLDDLVQRDASRRIRRVTAVTAMALAAMLIMAVLTVVALGARREAERQRGEAEGLIEFMLTDLRRELKGVTTLKVLTTVNRRALRYYGDRQDLDNLSDDSLERRARILHAMGADELDRANLGDALSAFRQAHRATGEQLQRDPSNPDRIFAHAQSEYWLGRVDEQRGNYRAAVPAYRHYQRLAQQLMARAPGTARSLGEIGFSETNLGIVNYEGFDRPWQARVHFENALRAFLRAEQLEPGDRGWISQVANVHAWLADALLAERRFLEARAHRIEVQRLTRRLLRAEPGNRDHLYTLIVSDRALARIALELHELGDAAALLAQSQARIMQLLRADADNMVWREQAVRINVDFARLLIVRGQFARARASLAEATRLIREADRRGADPFAARRDLLRDIDRLEDDIDRNHRETENGI
ncbi:MAG: hypothetical protein QOI38_2625 [Sphingomonadales bacterium]|jgi:tetratricopeptide (TPR) repeat protein|nr:hypothetical protein [Sphingomonadales bacterium]